MANSKPLTDSQLELLAGGIIAKIREQEKKILATRLTDPKMMALLSKVEKAAVAYNKVRADLQELNNALAQKGFPLERSNQSPQVIKPTYGEYRDDYLKQYSYMKANKRPESWYTSQTKAIKQKIIRDHLMGLSLKDTILELEKSYKING